MQRPQTVNKLFHTLNKLHAGVVLVPTKFKKLKRLHHSVMLRILPPANTSLTPRNSVDIATPYAAKPTDLYCFLYLYYESDFFVGIHWNYIPVPTV